MNLVPFSDDFEKAVIVGVLSDPELLLKVTHIVEPNDFYRQTHKEIFEVICRLEPENLDSLTVEDKLAGKEETLNYFRELVKDSDRLLPNVSNIVFYAETIKGKAKLRAGIDLGREIAGLCYLPNADSEETIQQLEDMFAKFLQQRVLDNKMDSTHESFKLFVESLGTKIDDTSGVKTGFIDLDLMLHRMEGLIILAARPGMGKTAIAINIARNVAADKRPVLFFSVEQSREQIFERLLAAEAEVGLEDIRTGAFINSVEDTRKIEYAEEALQEILERIHIDDRADIPTSYITSVARQKKYEWKDMGLIVVDYLHILRQNGKQTVDALGDIVKELRALGKELNCPVLLLSQLSRANEQRTEGKVKNRRPELTDLRSSGEIEQSADVVIFLYRDGYYKVAVGESEAAEVIVKKHRNGRQGIVLLDWYPSYVKFKNPAFRRK